MTTAAAFALQLHIAASTLLRLFGCLVTDKLSNDFIEKLKDLPDPNTMFGCKLQ